MKCQAAFRPATCRRETARLECGRICVLINHLSHARSSNVTAVCVCDAVDCSVGWSVVRTVCTFTETFGCCGAVTAVAIAYPTHTDRSVHARLNRMNVIYRPEVDCADAPSGVVNRRDSNSNSSSRQGDSSSSSSGGYVTIAARRCVLRRAQK